MLVDFIRRHLLKIRSDVICIRGGIGLELRSVLIQPILVLGHFVFWSCLSNLLQKLIRGKMFLVVNSVFRGSIVHVS